MNIWDERFWAKVDKTPSELGCWLWTAYKNAYGYGTIKTVEGMRLAHRRSYVLRFGTIPEGMQVDHKYAHLGCPRHCVNPAHLRLATHKENQENRRGNQKRSTSGYRGVTFHKKTGTWNPRVHHAGSNHSLGYWPYYELHVAGYRAMMKRNELYTHNDKDRLN